MKRILIALGVFVVLGVILNAAFNYSKSRDSQLFGELVHRVDTSQPVIALTFDDGPTPENTGVLLESLAQENTPATFFLMGRDVVANPEAARAIMDAGHEIGNHSWDHPRMVAMTPRVVRSQLSRTDDAIRALGYTGPLHFRPPYGRKLVVLPWVLDQQDRTTIMWSIEPETTLGFEALAQDLAAHVIETAQAGDIVLLHGMYSTNQSTREALPLILNGLRNRGFEFVTVSELLALR